ncbi:MAG: chorismate synthase [Phycisphaerales bacterium]|nr:MAG: chorismate synthase [Phycisphaerales bacterium]
MGVLAYQTAGESHGPGLLAIVTGMPSDVPVDEAFINAELSRRQGGYGRGGRQRIESDAVQWLSGVRLGRTLGSPIAMRIANRDARLDDLARTPPVHRPRPGHADLAGALKWLTTDCRATLERASARETAARVAAGALARVLLRLFGIEVFGFVRSIGGVGTAVEVTPENWRSLRAARDASETYCPDGGATAEQVEAIRRAKVDKDTVGGVCEVHVFGVPPGLGSCMDWRQKLDARLAYAVMSIQAFKAVEIGLGLQVASLRGSQVHDPIRYDPSQAQASWHGYVRDRNNAGGIEGGMSNGQPVVVRGAMKPISTLLAGMPSVDLNTKQAERSAYERSDVCAVPAASVVMENVVGFEVTCAFLEKTGGDSLAEVQAHHEAYVQLVRSLPLDPPMMTLADGGGGGGSRDGA